MFTLSKPWLHQGEWWGVLVVGLLTLGQTEVYLSVSPVRNTQDPLYHRNRHAQRYKGERKDYDRQIKRPKQSE